MNKTKAEGFGERELQGVYRAIRERRDVRSGFLPEMLNDDVLLRLLGAAHHAPSVGLMQPWRFIVIRSPGVRSAVRGIFSQAHEAARPLMKGSRPNSIAG